MTEDKKKSNLSNEDREELCRVVCDLETGNHLLGRKRTLGHRALICYVCRIQGEGAKTEVDQEILDYCEACRSEEAMRKYNEKWNIEDEKK